MGRKKIVTIGAGPAGMMAAVRAAQLGGDVTLVEKNPAPGRKLLLTAGGRCNFTNVCSPDKFISSIPGNGEFLRDAFRLFSNRDLIAFFRERGMKVLIDEEGRVFPATNRSLTVLEALEKEIGTLGVRMMFGKRIREILAEGGRVTGVALLPEEEIPCQAVVLATGGITYPSTGSSGEGFDIAKKLGHRIVRTRPGLVALETHEDLSALEGLSLREVKISVSVSGKKRKTPDKGDVLFTGKGVSGPLFLSCSGQIVDWLDEGKDVRVSIDVMPDIEEEALFSRINSAAALNPKRTAVNLLRIFVPGKLGEVILDLAAIKGEKVSAGLSIKEKRFLAGLIKRFSFRIKGPASSDTAMITKGGVSTKDIDPCTMASRLVKGLFFAGEMIDVDGDTGGYNLQAAFSTGYLAGQNAVSA